MGKNHIIAGSMPAHHDAANHGLWRAIEPVFQALRDRKPDLVTISKTYREPTCFDTRPRIGQ